MTLQHPPPNTNRRRRSLYKLSRLIGRLRRLCRHRRELSNPPESRNGPNPENPSGRRNPNRRSDRESQDNEPSDSDPAGKAPGGSVALDHLRAARLWVAANRPYYAAALFGCPLVVTDDEASFAIDKDWRIYANRRMAETLPIEQLASLFIHELNHALRSHIDRARRLGVPQENRVVWNIAADCEINDDLVADDLDVRPDLVFPADYGLDPGQLAEAYYRQLIDNAVPITLTEVCCNSASGDPHPTAPHIVAEGLSPARREQLRRRTAQAVAEHQRVSGDLSVPAGLARWAKQHTAPAADWRRILAAELRKGLRRHPGDGDWTWARPPRRPDPHNSPLLRPGTARHSAGIAVVIDTSGSMQAADHERAANEIHAILTRAVPDEAITVYSVDTAARTSQTVHDARRIQIVGGGGTDMAAGICTAAQARPRPAAIIVITDGYTPWPPTRPHGNTAAVIAVLTRPHTAAHVPPWITAIDAHAPQTASPGN